MIKAERRNTTALNEVNRFSRWPYYADDEREAVSDVLASGRVNYWTGERGREFERAFAEMVGSRHAIAVSNGTAALEAALYACEIGAGDEVVVTSRTFIASASCVVMRGARPVMADVDPVSQNVTRETIEAVLSEKTKAVIVVHLAGWPCDMGPIMSLAKEHGLFVIEDCAQACGAQYKGDSAGALGHIAAFSFCQDKIMTTGGEGGMITTDDDELWRRAWSFKDHGKSYEAVYERQHGPGYRWLHESFGTNARMTEMQAAIGLVQLRKLSRWLEIRRRNAVLLNDRLGHASALRLTLPPADIVHAYYKYYAFVRHENLKPGWNRDRIMETIIERGVPCQSGSCSEIYLEKAFEKASLQPSGYLPVARELGETSLLFPVHPTLSVEDIHDMCDVVEEVLCSATI